MILKHERDPNWLPRIIGEYHAREAARKFSQRLKAAALLTAFLLLAVPPFLRPAEAIMFQYNDHKIGWEDADGGMRFCYWDGCFIVTPAPSAPRPYVPPYGHDQS